MAKGKTKKRTIRYCEFDLTKDGIPCSNMDIVYKTLDRLKQTKNEESRNQDREDVEKAINIRSITKHESFYWIAISSAKYGYVTKFMDNQGHTRESDKRLNEGEEMVTHMCLMYDPCRLVASVESNRDGVRFVIECAKGVSTEPIIAKLFKLSRLEDTYSFNQVALVDKKPRLLNMKQLLEIKRYFTLLNKEK